MAAKRKSLKRREAEVLFMVEDLVTDPVKISAEGDIEIAEVNSILEKLDKLEFIKIKKRGEKIISAEATEEGKVYMEKHRKKVPY